MGDALRREALLARLTRAAPRVVMMTAPAGFGKTALASQCLDAWGDRCTVFDRAESLESEPDARERLQSALADRGAGQVVVICSREPLRQFSIARYALPHELIVLRASDLAFDLHELRELFVGVVEDESLLARVLHLSQGWPVAVFLLRRLAEEGRLSSIVDRPDDPAFRELHEYLCAEVLQQFDEPSRREIFTCAALNPATAADFAAFDESAVERLTSTGFVALESDRLIVHPLLASLVLRGKEQERIRALRELAQMHAARGSVERAAEVYLQIGDTYAAAAALGAVEVIADRAPSARYREVLAKLDPGLFLRFPRLWGVQTLTRLFCSDSASLLDESETVWRTLPRSTSVLERYYVLVFRVLLMSYLGHFEAAFAALEEFAAIAGASDPPQTPLDGHLVYLRGLLRARRGQFDAGELDLNVALPFVERMDVTAAGSYLTLGTDIARVRGEWSVERQFIVRGRERAISSGLANFIAMNWAETLVGAWFAGDRQGFNDAAVELERIVEQRGVNGFAYLAHVARGRAASPQPADLPKFTIFGMLIALSRSRDEVERATLARESLAKARDLAVPFVEALAAIAVALCEPEQFDTACAIAQKAASQCEAPAFVHAVNAFSQQHDNVGMLTPFVVQITRDRSEAAPIALDVLAGRVRVDGTAVRVSGREFELLAALAQRREPTARTKLAALLWPDLDEFAARNALSVCLHRLRSHLRRDDAVERDFDGYRLHADAFVDLWEIDRAAAIVRSRERLRESDRALLVRALERLREERHAAVEGWEWFAPSLRRLDDLRTELAQRVAGDALERGDPDAALAYASEIIAFDPCDEPAREIAIRAHLAVGDRAAALRQFRQYRDVLRQELAAEPSAALTELVMSV